MCKEHIVPILENKRVTLTSRLRMDAGSEEVSGYSELSTRSETEQHSPVAPHARDDPNNRPTLEARVAYPQGYDSPRSVAG